MRVRPTTPERLTAEIAELLIGRARRPWTRVAVDGHPQAGTEALADSLIEPLRIHGHPTVRIRTADFLRPASLRLEHGRDDPDSFYWDWFDFDGLRREVLDPLAEDGTGRVLPALWDPEADRSPRLSRVSLPAGGLAVVDGPLLLGGHLPFDFGVHLWLPAEAMRRLTPGTQQWALPAFEHYARQIRPERLSDFVVRTDRPGRPAVVDSWH